MNVSFRIDADWYQFPPSKVKQVIEIEKIFRIPFQVEGVVKGLIHGPWGFLCLVFIKDRLPEFALVVEENEREYAFGCDEVSLEKTDSIMIDSYRLLQEVVHAK